MMYRRIFTSLCVVLVGLAVAVPVATASYQQQALVHQQLGEIGAWAVPTAVQGQPSVTSERALVRQRLGEIGAWAVPTAVQSKPSPASQRALVREQLGEIGAWAVPSKPATTDVAANSADFNWNDVGIGAALGLCALVLGVAGVVSIRRHHRPIPH